MYHYDLVVVGCGSSAYAFLKGLEKNQNFKDKKIAILCPDNYKKTTKKVNIKDISPKFLQEKNLLSLSYYLYSISILTNNFSNIGVHGIGGMCRIWGSSIGTFDKESLEKNNLNYKEFISYYKECEEFLPFCGNENDEIKNYFSLSQSKSVTISQKIKNVFGSYLNKRFKIGYPRLLIKNSCNNCNQCLIGCELDSIWYPVREDFLNINLDISFLESFYAKSILENQITVLDKNKSEKLITTKYTILAGGAISNYNLLAPLCKKEFKAKLLTTPALAFAFFNFSKNRQKEFFGMGNATFILEDESKKSSFYGNFYDGYSLSISKGKVFSKNSLIDKIYKIASKYMVAGAGFLSSDYANCEIDKKDEKIVISGTFDNNYQEKSEEIKSDLKNFTKESKGVFAYFKKASLGADIHYAGGVPKELYSKDLIINGNLKNIDFIKVVGGSTFSYLSPISPTLSYMANSYKIGKNLKF